MSNIPSNCAPLFGKDRPITSSLIGGVAVISRLSADIRAPSPSAFPSVFNRSEISAAVYFLWGGICSYLGGFPRSVRSSPCFRPVCKQEGKARISVKASVRSMVDTAHCQYPSPRQKICSGLYGKRRDHIKLNSSVISWEEN